MIKADKAILIVTGLSGAGKHQVLYQLEDFDYFCIDNLPAPLLEASINILRRSSSVYHYLALGIDVRTQAFHHDLKQALTQLRKKKIDHKIIYLEAKEEELLRRFSETRRPHPVKTKKPLSDRIRGEIKQLSWLRKQADYIIDTTFLTPPELRRQLAVWLDQGQAGFQLTVSSFGFKRGLPKDADMIVDVRCLPNPFYQAKLKNLTGKHRAVKSFVLKEPMARDLIDQIDHLIRAMMDGFIREGKQQLHLCIGCTGGQHRSVVIADSLKKILPGKVMVHHRELTKQREASHGQS